MKSDKYSFLIEGRNLFGKPNGLAYYSYNLIYGLCKVNKKDEIIIWYGDENVLKKSIIDFKQHNLKQKYAYLPFPSIKKIDIFHNIGKFLDFNIDAAKRIITIRNLTENFDNDLKDIISLYDAVICCSNYTKQKLMDLYMLNENKIHVIYESVSPKFFPQSKLNSSFTKARYNIKGPFLFTIGPFNERKKLTYLLEAYNLLRFEFLPTLVIAGEIENKLKFNNKVDKLELNDKVKYLGYIPQSDIISLLSDCEAFISLYKNDGTGKSVLEAMSCGAPVIASKDSAITEIAPDFVIITEINNPEELSSSIKKLISDKSLQNKLKIKGLNYAKNFSIEKTAIQTLNVYNKLIGKAL